MPSHAELVLAQLSSQRQWGFLCDVAVVIGDTQFRAHRAVLAACSALFRMFFIQDSRGQQSLDLSLDLSHTGVSAQSFDRILQYMYQGHSTANNSAELSELKEAMLQLQMDFVPETLEELSRAQAPGSGSRLMFGVRMFPTRPDANANANPRPGPAPESSSSTGNSRPLSVEELPVVMAPPLGEEPCDLRRSLRKPERLKERPRFGRTFTCDDCGFVFSCEKLLIEHILTCTNRKNPPPIHHGRDLDPSRDPSRRAGTDQSSPNTQDLLNTRVKSEPEDWTRTEPGLVARVTVKSEPEDPEPGGSQLNPDQSQNQDQDSKRIKLEPGANPDQQQQQEEETHCELCGLEVKDLAAHYVSAHTSHMCACGRCGAVLPKGRRLQEHAQRCAERLNPDRDPDRDPNRDQDQDQDPNPDPDQTQDLQELPDQPENPEEESEEEEQEEEEEMEACPLLDTCENAGSSLAGLPPAAFPLEEPRRRHFCGICGRGFFQRCHLREHYTVHTKHKQFTCVTCGKGFLRQRQLRLHQDMHRGVARYVCPVCDQGTFLKQDHVRHMISHLSPGETICQVCFQMFPGPGPLEEHMEVHLYICYVCGEKFRLRKDMRSHVHASHSKRV